MAIKITQAGSSGWVFSGKGVHVYAAPKKAFNDSQQAGRTSTASLGVWLIAMLP